MTFPESFIASTRPETPSLRRQAIRLAWHAAILCTLAALVLPAGAQSDPSSNVGTPAWVYSHMGPDGNEPGPDRMKLKQLQALNAQRQKSLVEDTNKLLQLAKELNEAALPGRPPMPAPLRLHKLAEIEKLAKRVRDKMSYSLVGGPDPDAPIGLWLP